MPTHRKTIIIVGKYCRVQCGRYGKYKFIRISAKPKICREPTPLVVPLPRILPLTLHQILPDVTSNLSQITVGQVLDALYPGLGSLLQANPSASPQIRSAVQTVIDPFQQTIRSIVSCIVKLTLGQILPHPGPHTTIFEILNSLLGLTLGQALGPCGYFHTSPIAQSQVPPTTNTFKNQVVPRNLYLVNQQDGTLTQKLDLIRHMAQQHNDVNTIVKNLNQ